MLIISTSEFGKGEVLNTLDDYSGFEFFLTRKKTLFKSFSYLNVFHENSVIYIRVYSNGDRKIRSILHCSPPPLEMDSI